MIRYDPYRTDFGEIGDKLFENIAGHLGIDEEEEDDDDSDRVDIFMTKVRNMFTKKMDVWWATNKPKAMEADADNKENANSLN